jgi:acyloxyacyl hydrolase
MLKFFVFFLCFFSVFCLIAQEQPAKDESIHKPLIDLDGDLFSTENGLRGCDWRGRDKDDLDATVYPGCHDSESGLFDNNCNGIYGWTKDWESNYEQLFCKSSQARGVVMFGDSAAAAFHIPKNWIIEAGLTPLYKNLLPTLGNEFDWPQKSWSTGFVSEVAGDSIYLKMRDRNRANHRDYQNLAVNGAKSVHFKEQVGNLARKPSDKPILAFVAYIGNDICKKSLDQMTTPEEFRPKMLEGLAALDQKAPANSKVFMVGLVDGRILWNTMYDRRHPLGLTYAEFYQFLDSMDGNPCRTWLTSDATSRDKASARAQELSLILQEIAKTQKYNNIELAYMDFPLQKIWDMWVGQGGDPAELIEAVDGFHPSHTFHRLMAKVVWDELLTKYPSFVGPINPHNAEIIKLFGEQGGH